MLLASGVIFSFVAEPLVKLLPENSKLTMLKITEGLDIKGEKGYVLAPPSVRENGQKYFFFRGDVVKVKTHSLLPLSKKLVEDLMKELKKV